jgi:hypothetical protein
VSQNQSGYGLSVEAQNQREDEDGVAQASISSGLLHVEASWVKVFQSILKTGGGMIAGDARGTIMEVA